MLPTVTLALAQGAVLLRFVRSATLDVLHQDYIRTARAKGLTRTQALYRHGLRNASLPIISILGVQVASLIAGVVVIERVFTLPGVGQMLVRDIGSRDLEKVQGTVLLIAIIVLVIGFLVDVAHRLRRPAAAGAAREAVSGGRGRGASGSCSCRRDGPVGAGVAGLDAVRPDQGRAVEQVAADLVEPPVRHRRRRQGPVQPGPRRCPHDADRRRC